MYPFLFGIRTYAVLYVLGMIVHFVLALRLCRRRGFRWTSGLLLGLCYIFGMSFGAKLLYDLLEAEFAGWLYLDPAHYARGGFWGGPLAYLSLAVPGVLILAKHRRAMLDLVVLTLPVPMILAKLGCFAQGCCYGTASSLPWAMTLVESIEGRADVPRHPAPLYEILVLLFILVVFLRLDAERWKGRFLLWFIFLYGIGRPAAEILRDSQRHPIGPFSASQLICMSGAFVAGVLLFLLGSRAPQIEEKETTAETPFPDANSENLI